MNLLSNKIHTVSQLNDYIKNLIGNDKVLNKVLVTGEISNFKASPAGHYYFTLKDSSSEISCVMFKNYQAGLNFFLDNGLKVNVLGRIAVYHPKGTYQILVEAAKPEGLGELYLKIEQLKKKLAREGLFSEERKRKMPLYPQKVGVVTSLYGAALHDIIKTFKKRNDSIQIFISSASVQGVGAEESVAEAINKFNRFLEADVVIVARGGGSLEDLMAFNSEMVARAIFNSRAPVISAVGHETDYMISDMVADLRAATPTFAAQICSPTKESILEEIENDLKRMEFILRSRLEKDRAKLLEIADRTRRRSPSASLRENQQKLDDILGRLIIQFKSSLKDRGKKLVYLERHLNALNPYGILKRGYSITRKLSGKEIITSSRQVRDEDLIETQLFEGKIVSKVASKKE